MTRVSTRPLLQSGQGVSWCSGTFVADDYVRNIRDVGFDNLSRNQSVVYATASHNLSDCHGKQDHPPAFSSARDFSWHAGIPSCGSSVDS